jgi:hypothetical protein
MRPAAGIDNSAIVSRRLTTNADIKGASSKWSKLRVSRFAKGRKALINARLAPICMPASSTIAASRRYSPDYSKTVVHEERRKAPMSSDIVETYRTEGRWPPIGSCVGGPFEFR